MDLALLLGGSALLKYRGLTLYTKSGIEVKPALETFDIEIDGPGKADERVKGNKITLSLTPSGAFGDVGRLFPYLSRQIGEMAVPVVPVTSLNTTSDQAGAVNHPFVTGDRVMWGTRGTLPAATPALDADTYYFVNAATADALTLHLTRDAALAGTDPVDFTAAGTGDQLLVGQFPLEIYTKLGKLITFHSAAITKQPGFSGSAEKTMWGDAEVTVYVKNRARVTDANSIYTITDAAYPGDDYSSDDIITQSYFVAWADQKVVESVTALSDELGITAHALANGTKVYVGTTGTLPTSTPQVELELAVFARTAGADAVTLHPTQADAVAGTNTINFADGGTGTHFLTVDNPPFSLMDTKMGVELEFPVSFEDVLTDRDGVVNQRLSAISGTAKLQAMSLSEADVLIALRVQGSTAARGRSLSAAAKDLNIFAPGVFVRLTKAALKSAPLKFNMKDDRVGELEFVGTRPIVNGAVQPVGRIASTIA